MTHKVQFHPLAAEDLDNIDTFIAVDSPANAVAFVRRVREQCDRLSEMPHRGRLRPDLPGEVRTMAFERTVVIAYQIEPATVTILRIFYAGQDFSDILGG